MSGDAEMVERWLLWWRDGYWQQADSSWHDNAFFSLPAEHQQTLTWQHPQAVAASFGIPPALPPLPQSQLLSLVAMTPEQRIWLLALLAGACAPQSTPDPLTSANLIWCRRLTKALRCENWFNADCFVPWTTGSLLVVRALSAESWPRIRLLFPRSWGEQVDEYPTLTLPSSRLYTLWDAVIWQVQQSESASDVDPQENNPAE